MVERKPFGGTVGRIGRPVAAVEARRALYADCMVRVG